VGNGVLQELFTNRSLRRFLSRTRYLFALALGVPLARYMRLEWLPVAVGISLFGQLIQAWCFASLVKNRELSVRGPYLLARNPMYLGRFFLILGFVCLLGSPLAIVAYAVLYYLYMLYRVKGEERRLRRAYTDEYERYCSEVRRFLPAFGKLGHPDVWFFDAGMFLENNGHWNILLTLVMYAGLYALHRLWLG
jgi:hypothetical protein